MTETTDAAAAPAQKFKTLVLPAWAALGEPNDKLAIVIDVDTETAMKEWHDLMGADEVDQFTAECAYQCAKMDLQRALEGTEFDPRLSGKSHQFNFARAPDFEQKKLPKGKGAELASKGKQARELYKRFRGAIPFSA